MSDILNIENFLKENIPNYKINKQEIYNFFNKKNYFNEISEVLLYLHNNNFIDLIDEIKNFCINGEMLEIILDIIGNKFESFNLNKFGFIKFIKEISKIRKKIYIGSLTDSIKKFADDDEVRAKEIIEIFENEIKIINIVFLISLFQGIQQKSSNYVLEKSIKYLKSTEDELIKIGLILAKDLNFPQEFNFNEFLIILENINFNNDDLIYYLINLYCKLWELGKLPLKKIITISRSKINNVALILSDFINKNFNELKKEKEFDELLSLFYLINNNNSGLNKILSILFTDDELWKSFLFNWIDNNMDYINKIGKEDFIDGRLPVFFYEITNNDKNFSTIITLLFNSEKSIYHKFAIELINFNIINIKKTITLDIKLLNSFNDIDCIFILRKIFGYLYDVEYLIPLIFSFLYKDNLSDKLYDCILDVFLHFISFNYPLNTKNYTKNILDNKINFPKPVYKISEIVYKAVSKYLNDIESLPMLNEIKSKSKNNYEIWKAKNKIQSKMMNESSKKSVFFELCSHIIIKYGKGSFCFNSGKLTDKSQMQKFESFFTIPSNFVLDPIGNELTILQFRSEKKEDINADNS